MPWKYENIKTWKAIYPAIKGKIFFGRVHQFCKAPISLILNGEIPQFKIPELNKNEKYKGIIINIYKILANIRNPINANKTIFWQILDFL